jgi:gas vesicle protein
MKNSNKILIALGAGAAIGGLLGVLFAPHKGSKTRRKITEEGKKVVSQIKEVVDEGLEKCKGTNGHSERMQNPSDKYQKV